MFHLLTSSHQRYQTRRSNWGQKIMSPIAVLRKTRSHPQRPDFKNNENNYCPNRI